jgi:hypothetical protein
MDDETREAINLVRDSVMLVLGEHGRLLEAIHGETHETNGRVTKAEVSIGRLNWAVFLGGASAFCALGVALGWLIVLHLHA